jgi:hypothetical protein
LRIEYTFYLFSVNHDDVTLKLNIVEQHDEEKTKNDAICTENPQFDALEIRDLEKPEIVSPINSSHWHLPILNELKDNYDQLEPQVNSRTELRFRDFIY